MKHRKKAPAGRQRRRATPFFLILCSIAFFLTAQPAAASEEQPAGAAAETDITLADLNGKRIGILTGTNFPELVEAALEAPEVLYYSETSDLLMALMAGKIDSFPIDEPVARNMMAEDPRITYISESLAEFELAPFFPKTEQGEALCSELSAFLLSLKEDGTMEELQKKWFDGIPDASMMRVDPAELPDKNGTIRVATIQYPPFSIAENEGSFGYEVELITLFAEEKGYAIQFKLMNADAVMAEVQSGKSDIGIGATAVTEERQENVSFTEPDFEGGVVMVVLKDEAASEGSFFQRIRSNFEKTFLREDRYKMFLQGIGMTVLITIASALLGTALGFLIFTACRRGNRIANGLAKAYVWLITGMPMVVLLMILYYVVFGRMSVSGVVVAIIGFTLTFGATVFSLLRSGVAAIDRGQTEAASALGYPDRQAFYRIILPQAMPHFMPAYRAEISSLIRATAIVGYITVQDLTRMGDLVRSRTYEAFFPLIAVAILYFVLAAILVFLVDRIAQRIDPTVRKKDEILKGVITHD